MATEILQSEIEARINVEISRKTNNTTQVCAGSGFYIKSMFSHNFIPNDIFFRSEQITSLCSNGKTFAQTIIQRRHNSGSSTLQIRTNIQSKVSLTSIGTVLRSCVP